MTGAWTVGRVVAWAADDFRARGIESPRFEAEILLAHALRTDRLRVLVEPERTLGPDELAAFRDVVRRRRAREPVAYIRGEREFWGRAFHVDRRVLVPRPDTESLVETALGRTADRSLFARALDLCTGSGCVAITIARERPTWRMDATDVSPDAIDVARDNAARLGAVWGVRWLVGDLWDPLDPSRDRYDLVTANPPYVPDDDVDALASDVRDFEPRVALVAPDGGLAVTRRIVERAPAFLRPGGVLAVEVGAGQADAVAAAMEAAGLGDVRRTRDYGGHERVVSAARGR